MQFMSIRRMPARTKTKMQLLASRRSYIRTMQASEGRIAGIKDKNVTSQKGTCQEEAFKCCSLKLFRLRSCDHFCKSLQQNIKNEWSERKISDQKEKSVVGKNISGKKWSPFFTNIANIYMRKVPISRNNYFLYQVESSSFLSLITMGSKSCQKERQQRVPEGGWRVGTSWLAALFGNEWDP